MPPFKKKALEFAPQEKNFFEEQVLPLLFKE